MAGCKSRIPEGNVDAYVLEYKVTYLTDKAGSITTKLLPSKMTVVFADHYVLNRIEGFFGQFSLIYVGNLKNESVTTMLKVFDKKYVYYGTKGELPCGFSEMNNLDISLTGNQMQIAGHDCRQYSIKMEGDSTFTVYGTSDLGIKKPNVITPLKEINDVLLEFDTSLSLLRMKLTATRIDKINISWDLFRVPEDYEEKTKAFVENTIDQLFK
jgi:hypothetical protein